VPSAPAQPTKKSASSSHIEPEWARPFTGGSDIRGYRVYKDGVHDPALFVTDWDTLFLSIEDDITPGQNYEIRVSAYNDVGEGEQSPAKTIMAAAVPSAPTDIAMVSQSADEIVISWSEPYNGGTEITTYQIWWDEGQGGLSSSFEQMVGSTGLVNQYTVSSNI
jgi:hypothetical protein